MKVALVHEFLTQYGGAERVLENFAELFPDAAVYTLVHNPKAGFRHARIKTGALNFFAKLIPYKWLLPLMPRAIEQFDFNDFDLLLSDSSAFAKGAITGKQTMHISYCHTPTRYVWESQEEYLENQRLPKFVKLLAHLFIENYLKKWDYRAAQRPHFLIANSNTVKERIKKYYNRDADVIHPPVDTDFFRPMGGKQDYFFHASRLEPYKRTDLVIEAFNKLKLPLKIAGSGTHAERLKSQALGNIEFMGRVSDEQLRQLYSGAKAFVFPALEDAGIMVLESLACGTPVIGLAAGGTAEFVRDGENGILFKNQNASDIANALQRFNTISWQPEKLRQSALPFDKKEFQKKILSFIETHASRN